MSSDKTITVELTVIEARALRLASIFGGPDPPPESLESARKKLGEAETAAKSEKEQR